MKTHPGITRAEVEALLDELAAFCRTAGAPTCYQNWTPETLRDYIAFHAGQQTFVYVRAFGVIAGTAVAWQTTEAHIRARATARNAVFNWEPADPCGDSVFVADVVATVPGALESLIAALLQKHPHWPQLKWFTYRHRKLVQITPYKVARILSRRKVYHVRN